MKMWKMRWFTLLLINLAIEVWTLMFGRTINKWFLSSNSGFGKINILKFMVKVTIQIEINFPKYIISVSKSKKLLATN